jgi:hypothetical protein
VRGNKRRVACIDRDAFPIAMPSRAMKKRIRSPLR